MIKFQILENLFFSNYPKKNELKFRSTVLVNEIIRFRGRLDLDDCVYFWKKTKFFK